MTKVIVFNDEEGNIIRVGYYVDGKWKKWIPKKQMDKYIEECDDMENRILEG